MCNEFFRGLVEFADGNHIIRPGPVDGGVNLYERPVGVVLGAGFIVVMPDFQLGDDRSGKCLFDVFRRKAFPDQGFVRAVEHCAVMVPDPEPLHAPREIRPDQQLVKLLLAFGRNAGLAIDLLDMAGQKAFHIECSGFRPASQLVGGDL